jgi:hypothetical protein
MKSPTLPIRRDLQFKLPADKLRTWHPYGLHVAHFFNVMSIFFPAGERFFIDSVRHYRDRIKSEELKKAVTGFIGQEAMHGREHEEYNAALDSVGLPASRLERWVIGLLNFVKKYVPARGRLAATIALEHFTAILADILLREPEVLKGADPRFAALWRWHALEETEHKAVAYDVYQEVMGTGVRAYLLRVGAMISSTILFWSFIIPFHFVLVVKDGGLFDLRGWWMLFRGHWLFPGTLRRIMPAYFSYFRPGFHPWQHDNRHFLVEIDQLTAPYRSEGQAAA